MKTALETLIEKIDLQLKNKFCPVDASGLKMAKLMATELLPIERDIIEDAFVAGDERGTGEIPFNAEQYFNQTFK